MSSDFPDNPLSSELEALVAHYHQRHFDWVIPRAQFLAEQFPDQGLIWSILGAALSSSGDRKAAKAPLRQAVACQPFDPNAHNNLGVLLSDLGENEEAEECYRHAIALDDAHVQAWNNLGVLLKDTGKPVQAAQCYREAVVREPAFAQAHYNLALVISGQGDWEEAETHYRLAIALKPDYAKAYVNLATLVQAHGGLEEARALYTQAVTLAPEDTEVLNKLAQFFMGIEALEEAEQCLRKAIALRPSEPEAYASLGQLFWNTACFAQAEPCFREALRLKPDFFPAHIGLANLMRDFGMVDQAREVFLGLLDYPEARGAAWMGLGGIHKDMGELLEAEDCYQKALAANPKQLDARSGLLFIFNYSERESLEHCVAFAREYGQILTKNTPHRFSSWKTGAHPERLRVGFVSGDFRNHPVGYFLEGVIAHLNQDRLELLAYTTHPLEDDLTARIKPFFSVWKSLVGLGDEQAAQLIHADAPHVLIDLSGHTAYHRLPVFARKPAPVQATWLGYFATSGVKEIDWFIADATGVPPEHHTQFIEKPWYLPNTRLCFTPPRAAPAVSPLPWLEKGYPTLGCFQNLSKITPKVLSIWGQILKAVPTARLRIQSPGLKNPKSRIAFEERLREAGLDSERVILHPGAGRREYLALHREVDFIVDTFPYPGGTTTCEALWMGVPTVTLAGQSLIARQGASLLSAGGLHDWVADDLDHYVTKACQWARAPEALSALRAGLRQQVMASPLFDGPRFAANLEAGLWGMWEMFASD
jgi:protein O-GlcNAc transferase